MWSAQIQRIQQMLNQLGYQVPLSGQYDNFTRNVIIHIQRKLNIVADGELSPNVVQAIIEAVKPGRPLRPQVVLGSYTATDAPSYRLPKPGKVS